MPDARRTRVEVGVTLKIAGEPMFSVRGFHASKRAMDAICYAPDTERLLVCRVRLGGTIIERDRMACATERTVLWMADATRTLHEFAIWCAEDALEARNVTDECCWGALETKRRWLDGAATHDELRAAIEAVERAASSNDDYSAYIAARYAADSEPREAARRASFHAAWADADDAFNETLGEEDEDVGWDEEMQTAWDEATDAYNKTRDAAISLLNAELERRLTALGGGDNND